MMSNEQRPVYSDEIASQITVEDAEIEAERGVAHAESNLAQAITTWAKTRRAKSATTATQEDERAYGQAVIRLDQLAREIEGRQVQN